MQKIKIKKEQEKKEEQKNQDSQDDSLDTDIEKEIDNWSNKYKQEENKIIYDTKIYENYPDQHDVFKSGKVEACWVQMVVDKVLPGVKMDSKGENLLILMALMKVYFGELIEEAKIVQLQWKDVGNLQPEHLYEAKQRMEAKQVQKSETLGDYL